MSKIYRSCAFWSIFIIYQYKVMHMQMAWKNVPIYPWASTQIRKITGCVCVGNVTHVPWSMSGSPTRGTEWGKTFPAFQAHAQPAVFCVSCKRTIVACWVGSRTYEPLGYYSDYLDPWEWIQVKFESKCDGFSFKKCTLENDVCEMARILSRPQYVNSLWPSDTIWRHKSESTLAQVMAWCLTAPSHYLNQCWLIISKFQWHSSECNFTRDTSAINHWN